MAWWPRSLNVIRKRSLFAAFILGGALVIVVVVGLVSFRVTDRLEKQTDLGTWLLADGVGRYFAEKDYDRLGDLLQRAEDFDVPFIVTDAKGMPWVWNEQVIGVPLPDSPEGLNDPDPRLLEMISDFDDAHEPIAILDPETDQYMHSLHYGPSVLTGRIRWLPWVELGLIALFFGAIVWALGVKREGEEQRLFAGMAKETAHQLGTPITSILGWVELLRDRVQGDRTAVAELERDVDRLSKVSARFSQIGSRPKLSEDDLASAVGASVEYFQRRLPHLGATVELTAECTARGRVRFNRELMEWVLENLIKNGIDAMRDRSGRIVVSLVDGPRGDVQLRVADDGAGIPAVRRNRIFEPGFTTKARGWGMGLALVRRIVVQYHRGRIGVEKTGPEGTTFLITLPTEEADRAV